MFPLSVPKLMVGAINGACIGIGLSQALMCDVRFAAHGAKFSTAFARRGLIAEAGASSLLPRLVGTSAALDLLLSGRMFLTDEALALGLVNRACEPEALVEEALAYGARRRHQLLAGVGRCHQEPGLPPLRHGRRSPPARTARTSCSDPWKAPTSRKE